MRLKTDWPLFLTVVGMVCAGLVFIYSSSAVVAEQRFGKPSYYFLVRQAAAAAFSFWVLMTLARKDYRRLHSPHYAFILLGSVLALLILVYFLDPQHHRWLPLGVIRVQPSEFAKPALIVFLAYFVTLRAPDINGRHTLLPAAMAMVMLAGAVVIADLGTAVVLLGTAAAVFCVAGLEVRYFKLACAATALIVVIAIVAKPYRLQRCIHFVDPHHKILDKIDPTGTIKAYAHSAEVPDTSYHARQSKIAVGSGGLFGKGLAMGTGKLFYLPEAHTDFIYAVVGEELGLFGSTLVLGGFLIILWRGFRLYWVALDDFGRYLAVGVTASLVFQAFINMSVVVDLAPTKGIPLPLISYGGSSLLSSMISLGLLLSVSERAR